MKYNKHKNSSSISRFFPRASLFILIIFSTTLFTLQFISLCSTPINTLHISQTLKLIQQWRQFYTSELPFLPLKDLRYSKTAMEGNTWFMSSINSTHEPGEAEHLHFPSPATGGRLLCLSGSNRRDGTKNSYALADPAALPPAAKFLSGITFISDTYYDYTNLWHGLGALSPFAAWHERKGCVSPARWILYHHGELRTNMSTWVRSLAAAVFGEENLRIETLDGHGSGGIMCFEEAVVFRRNEGGMEKWRKEKVYEFMRCKSRAYCGVAGETVAGRGESAAVRMTLLLREGTRAFKDDKAVIGVFSRECRKVPGCLIRVARPTNLTFCDQVKLMSETDVLVSTHGAQMTNMIFMDKNSSVMEFFPKGWKELAGVGQFVFRWIADGSTIRHKGAWYDPDGDECVDADKSKCFQLYKNRKIGLNETAFANWAADVLQEMRAYKLQQSKPTTSLGNTCSCR